MEVGGFQISKLPLPQNWPKECGRMTKVVERMLALQKQFTTAKSMAQRSIIQRQIDATDTEIDRLVYSLYHLTAKEISLVEGR